MSTDAPQPVEVSTDQPAKQPIEESLAFSIRNRGGWLTYTTDNQDAFLNEVQRRRDAGEDEADLNFEGGDPDAMLQQREQAEAAQAEQTAAVEESARQRIADIKPQIDARTQEFKDAPNKLNRAVAKLEFRMRGLLQDGDDVG
jgi:hypothetical protein